LALEVPGRAGCGPTHGEWLAAIGRLGRQAVPGGGGATQFGCMPPDWPAGQYFAHVAACCWGGTVAFAENAETIGTDLAAVQPAFLAGPPRLFERLAEALDEAMAGATGPQRWVVRAAVARRLGPVDGFVLARARRLLGLGRVATALCVGEAPPVPLVARFDGLGVRVASVAPGQLPGLAPVPRVAHFIETSLAAT
jgi:long-subunit acyl-CoA synthetase (AMP-forming)